MMRRDFLGQLLLALGIPQRGAVASTNSYTMICTKVTQSWVFSSGSMVSLNEFTVAPGTIGAIVAKDGIVTIQTIGPSWFTVGRSYRCDLTAL